jgi:hypothetical protein
MVPKSTCLQILFILVSLGCGSKKIRSDAENESIERLSPSIVQAEIVDSTTRTAIDTVFGFSEDGHPLKIFIFSKYDSLPNQPIKDFVVRDGTTGELVFKSFSKRLALGYETDPMKGEFDSLFLQPTFIISSQNPLIVSLDFLVYGSFTTSFLGDITYPFYQNSTTLRFLRYKFFGTKKGTTESSLRFTPNKCDFTETELLAQFNKIKKENHFYSDLGTDLMKQAFNCFLNKQNPNYNAMVNEFRKAMGPTPDDPYTYYPYIIYLNEFIVNLTSE